MNTQGFDSSTERKATTGLEQIVLDGVVIDSPESVAEHMENFGFPGLEKAISETDPNDAAEIDKLIAGECEMQKRFGPDILKIPYGKGFGSFPTFRYGKYGYENYFMAYALFPDLMEKDFSLQAASRRGRTRARPVLM